MTIQIDRRSLVLGGSLGFGALMLPGGSGALAAVLGATGFTHNVASGEPGPDSMLLWTRYVPKAGQTIVTLQVEVALDPAFGRIVSGGSVRTGGYRDWTAKFTVDGLKPGTIYHYRFVAPDGGTSPVGRTKTLPVGKVDRFGLGVFSCSNVPFGHFNAYAHACTRTDMDLWFHVGDYLYEYQRGNYPSVEQAVAGRIVEPAGEMIHLADYRLRYASYRADPDLQRLHQIHPMIALWDDHETANDAWEGGAENHSSDKEGDWTLRKIAAIQVYREWMPVSDEPWKTYDIGTLATLYRTESRLLARTEQPEIAPLFKQADPDAALKAFRDGPWQDPSATMMGSTQESWLAHALRDGAKETGWQMVGMGTILGQTVMPKEAASWFSADADPRATAVVGAGLRAAKLGLPFNYDGWGGYPAARSRLLRAAQAADADLVMLTGDSHNAWAYALAEDGKPAGVEFAGHAVTSPGFEGFTKADPAVVARGLVADNPELKWCDTSHRGYMAFDITPRRVSGEWVMLKTIRTRSIATLDSHRMHVDRGRRVFAA